MLRLEKMELSGFKSFSDRTEVRFPAGITAVVGPNGCGKSNIGDAINWALGEQSAKMLRGKQMADVIFAGSEARRPVGLAEVSLHLRGAEGLGPDRSGSLVVTRRLFRNGESEYLLNGKKSRLKDIQDLLEQGHVGARTYATIEQGRIDQILNAKPKDRRLLIEDAAGIAGYKHKRRLTELKLEATQANLLRVHDIIVEVERQIRSLKRQAGRARRYRRLRDELRQRERALFAVRSARLDAVLASARQEETTARTLEAEGAAALSTLEVELIAQRTALESANKALREVADRLHRAELEIDREEGQVRACTERIEGSAETERRQGGEAEALAARLSEVERRLGEQQERVGGVAAEVERIRAELASQQGRLEQVQARQRATRETVETLRRRQFEAMGEAAQGRNRLLGTEQALERNRTQRARLEADRSEASDDLTRLTSETENLAGRLDEERRRVAALREACADGERMLGEERERLAAETERLSAAREQAESAAARLATLEDVATRFAGVSDGVRSLLGEGVATGVRAAGVVADFIEAAADVEGAAEGYLASFLPTVILESDDDVCRAAAMLRRDGAGRTSLICRSQPAGAVAVGTGTNGHGGIPAELLADPRVMGRLRERLTLRTSANGFIQDRLGDAVVVDTLETALDLHRRHPAADYLTREGDVVYASGVVQAGGRTAGDRGLLAHQRRIREARETSERAGEVAARQHAIVEARRGAVVRQEVELREHRSSSEEAQRRLVELELLAQRAVEDRERTDRRTTVLADELEALREEDARLSDSLASLRADVERAEQACATIESELGEAVALSETQEAAARAETEKTAGLRELLAARAQNLEAAEHERQRLTESVAELGSRLAAAREAIEQARRRGAEAAALRVATEERLAGRVAERQALQGALARSEQEIAELEQHLAAREQAGRAARQALEELRERTRRAEVERTKAEAAREHLDELCRQELGITATEAARDAGPAEEGAEAPTEGALEAAIAGIKEHIERIGPVNMTAIEEFAELEERHGFLSAQRDDLQRSMESLRETIRRINRSSRERFAEAFEAIRGNYQEIFKLLFNGGRADLRLEEGEDVLECGVEILAQPPGKRLTSIGLLSGGEKALSAIALLFAVFRYQPSPFCLLDEVDAALDESNVGRFARMLGEYAKQTQFIIVTHNKLTMESADLLYGVTMEEPGVSRLISMQLG